MFASMHLLQQPFTTLRRRNVDDDRAPPRKKQRVGQEDSVTDSPVTLDDWEEWALSV